MRVVLDTNIYISALMFGGLPGSLLDLAFIQAFDLVVSPPLLDELDEKLHFKFRVPLEDIAIIRIRLESTAFLVKPHHKLKVIRDDPDDNRILECALAGKAGFIVSGDRHLLNLKIYKKIPILTVREFLGILKIPD